MWCLGTCLSFQHEPVFAATSHLNLNLLLDWPWSAGIPQAVCPEDVL